MSFVKAFLPIIGITILIVILLYELNFIFTTTHSKKTELASSPAPTSPKARITPKIEPVVLTNKDYPFQNTASQALLNTTYKGVLTDIKFGGVIKGITYDLMITFKNDKNIPITFYYTKTDLSKMKFYSGTESSKKEMDMKNLSVNDTVVIHNTVDLTKNQADNLVSGEINKL